MELMLGKRIKELRIKRAITQTSLGKYLNVSSQTISKWENAVTYPDIQLIPELAAYFGISIDYLFDYKPSESIEMQIASYSNIINHITELMNTARLSGILALEQYLAECNDLEFYGLKMLLLGTPASVLEQCMRNMSINGCGTGEKMLDECIISGISAIANAMHPNMCREIMLSSVPHYINEQVRDIVEQKNREEIKEFQEKLYSNALPYEVTGLIEFICDLSDSEIQRLLSGCTIETITNSLFGASYDVCKRILDSISKRAAAEILEDMSEMHKHVTVPDSIIRKHQQSMIDMFNK